MNSPSSPNTSEDNYHLSQQRADHDLLVRIDTTVIVLTNEVKGLNSTLNLKYSEHEAKLNNHSAAINTNALEIEKVKTQIKTWGSMAAVVFVVIQIALHFIK
jgi:hypothetical protein